MQRFLKVILSLFRKKRIRYLGLTGLIFSYNNALYFIGSELLAPGDYDIVLYSDEIYRYEKDQKISITDCLKKEVLDKLEIELEKTGMRFCIHPCYA